MLQLLFVTAVLLAQSGSIPSADRAGTRDNPLLKRYEGSFIVFAERKSFAEFTLPLSRLEEVPERKTGKNNRLHEPKTKKALEGTYTRLVYLVPAERTPLEVLRNYQDEIREKRGKILFECNGEGCGGDPERSSSGGGGDTSLAMYLYPEERISEQFGSNGYCAMTEAITDQRYFAAELPSAAAHVSVLAYTIVSPNEHDSCRGFNGRTVAVVDIVEAKAREQKMVTVNASEMANAIAGTGKVALYGIYFDFNKTDIKPESDATLGEIGKLLKGSPAMKVLVVGHTDNVGTFAFNTDLSQRRAAAVVNALATRFAIPRDRLTPFGVSFGAPVASNRTEEGRAKNRRVELVENAPAK
jgi:outer membrane protein OmpA-like peptidoglycan-associated protein